MSKQLMMSLAVATVWFYPLVGQSIDPLSRSSGIALAVESKPATARPKIGVVKQMTMGDLMCYVDLTDLKGKPHHLGADFAICAKARKFLKKKVRVTYKKIRVNDCQSAEPCGKTRVENAIYKMRIVK